MNILDGLPFARIIFADSEYFARPGERVLPICFVAREYRTGRTWRIGMGEFGARALAQQLHRPIASTAVFIFPRSTLEKSRLLTASRPFL